MAQSEKPTVGVSIDAAPIDSVAQREPVRTPMISKIIAVVLLAGVAPWLVSMAAYQLLGPAQYVNDPLHEAFELAGSLLALFVAMLLLLRLRHDESSSHLLWVVAALVAMGLIDGLHAVHGISLQSWQRHGATLIGGVLFGLVWAPFPRVVRRRKGFFVLIVAGLALALGLWRGSRWMPVTWDPIGLYILPVKAANVMGGLGFLAAAVFFLRNYLRRPRSEDLVFGGLQQNLWVKISLATARVLRGAGYTVTEAKDGEEAIAKYRETGACFALVLTDMIMPGIGGLETARQIRAVNPGQKVVYCSGYSDDMVKSQGQPGEGVAIIGKPVEKAELLRKVRAAIDG